jgi:hypothetical protein
MDSKSKCAGRGDPSEPGKHAFKHVGYEDEGGGRGKQKSETSCTCTICGATKYRGRVREAGNERWNEYIEDEKGFMEGVCDMPKQRGES